MRTATEGKRFATVQAGGTSLHAATAIPNAAPAPGPAKRGDRRRKKPSQARSRTATTPVATWPSRSSPFVATLQPRPGLWAWPDRRGSCRSPSLGHRALLHLHVDLSRSHLEPGRARFRSAARRARRHRDPNRQSNFTNGLAPAPTAVMPSQMRSPDNALTSARVSGINTGKAISVG